MTLTDIKSDLFIFFGKHDTFSMEENFDELSELNILVAKAEKPFIQALIEKALDEYEAQKIIIKVEHEGKKTWILEKPLEKYSQTIELSATTIIPMTKMVNDYCEEIKNPAAKINPLAVSEADVQTMILILHELLKQESEGSQ